MKTPLTTYNSQLIDALQDVVREQWSALGFPFATGSPGHLEVIDPEALIWASLNLASSDARLLEAASTWVHGNQHLLVRHRLNRRVKGDTIVGALWQEIGGGVVGNHNGSTREQGKSARSLQKVLAPVKSIAVPALRFDLSIANLLLRARCLLGSDLRHFILVYLLARPQGGKLGEVKAWLSYSYKSLLEAVARWEEIRAIENQRGYVRLVDPSNWIGLLGYHTLPSIPLVNWFEAFSLVITLARALETAESKRLDSQGPFIQALRRDALEQFDRTILAEPRQAAHGWQRLRRVLDLPVTSP